MKRHELTDQQWELLAPFFPQQPPKPGGQWKDHRLMLNGVFWRLNTGAPWRDLPERFGRWNSVWKRFDRWAKKGTWQVVFEALQDPDLEWLILDSTVIRAHPCAAGAEKKRTAVGGKRNRPWAAAGAASAPRSTRPSVGWGCPSN